MVEALRGVNLSIPRGEYVAIMGASGSGKSTLMYLLGCLDRPTSGAYLLDGRNVARMHDEELSAFRGRTIGFIFQSFNLIPQLTIEENAEVPLFYQGLEKSERRERAIEALRMVELDHRLGHRPSELSGGQQQRAAIARALVTRPLILMADEPTGNLDSATGLAILRTFERLHEAGLQLAAQTGEAALRDTLVEQA
ncbi:MAG: ABC transporter ATP-binding protein, partial [Phycisphaerae bacterium]|nr:ABC transporter ATP-binding protein [Phycisphaerae bacterium]